jgi:EAL domain-containing protein (putative c-di-GMP-specific phosphodiesterase class I)
VRSTIELGHNMGLAVVAEGVEDEATFAELRALGCDMAQGYWLGRPLSPHGFADWLRDSEWARPGREKAGLRRVG